MLIHRNGKSFFVERAQLCKHLDVDAKIAKLKVWHVWDRADYHGNFRTKRAALAHIDHVTKGD